MNKELLDAALANDIPAEILEQQFPMEKPTGRDPAFWLRILFSCLVDADFLDTENFFEPEKADPAERLPCFTELLAPFSAYMAQEQSKAQDTQWSTESGPNINPLY